MIELRKVTKTYLQGTNKVEVLKPLDMQIYSGDYVAITGVSGSGKSTLMNILGCLDVPTSGKYLLSGIDIHKLSEDERSEIRNKKIGFVFQSFFLLPRLSALENVMLPLTYAKVAEKERKQRARDALVKMGLKERLDFYPAELSGGQKQRVAIARALVTEASLILADEPTGALDSKASEAIMNIFQQLNDAGKTIIVITHEATVARRATRQVILEDGMINKEVK